MSTFEFKRQPKDYIGLFSGAFFLLVGLVIVLFSGGEALIILFGSVFLFLGTIAVYIILKKWVTLKACKIMIADSKLIVDFGDGRKDLFELSEIQNARLDADGYLLFRCGGSRDIALPDILDLNEHEKICELLNEKA